MIELKPLTEVGGFNLLIEPPLPQCVTNSMRCTNLEYPCSSNGYRILGHLCPEY